MTTACGDAFSWRVGVVVPARNEAATVAECVESLRLALTRSRRPGWIVVVADRCHDATATLARRALGSSGEVLLCAAGSAGLARRRGTDHLLDLGLGPPESTWLATTDADGTVPPDWLATQLRLMGTGADAVAGVVRLDGDDDRALAARLRATYTHDGDGTHPHVHGANLGVRADAYLDAGGWAALEVGEDTALWDRLGERGWTRMSSIESWVTTSSRRVGRAPGGFAADLAALAGPSAVECHQRYAPSTSQASPR